MLLILFKALTILARASVKNIGDLVNKNITESKKCTNILKENTINLRESFYEEYIERYFKIFCHHFLTQ